MPVLPPLLLLMLGPPPQLIAVPATKTSTEASKTAPRRPRAGTALHSKNKQPNATHAPTTIQVGPGPCGGRIGTRRPLAAVVAITSCLVPLVTAGLAPGFSAIVELAVPFKVNEQVGGSLTVVKTWGVTLQVRATFPVKVVDVIVMGRLPGCPAVTVIVSFGAAVGNGARVRLAVLTFIVVVDVVVEGP